MNPVCPYGISKAAGVQICRFYRDRMGVYSSAGILYNHESPLRSSQFVSRKIVSGAVAIKKGVLSELVIADLDAAVDWGYAPDYADASGAVHTVREFVVVAFEVLGLNWQDHVRQGGSAHRSGPPARLLRGDSSRLQSLAGWSPQVDFPEMVALMIDAELRTNALCAGTEPDQGLN